MITIYGSDTCSYCLRAKNLATRYKLSYEWKDIEIEKNREEFMARIPDAKTIPQIFWYDKYIGGYEAFAEEIENTNTTYGNGTF